MTDRYEYKVIPAPRRAKRLKGSKTPAERFAATVEEVLNEEGRGGWEYLRAEVLPSEERPGLLKSRVQVPQPVLIFRRRLDQGGDVLRDMGRDPPREAPREALRAVPPPEPGHQRPALRAVEPDPQDLG